MIKKIRLFESCAISLGMLGFIIFSGFGISYAATLTTVCNDSNITAGSGVSDSAFCKDKSTTDPVIGTLNLVTNLITGIAGFVAVVMIIISGFKMVSSSGNPEKISQARTTIIYSLVGLLLIALARTIILFIVRKMK